VGENIEVREYRDYTV